MQKRFGDFFDLFRIYELYVFSYVTTFHFRFETVEECKQTCNVDENVQDYLDSGAVCNQASKCGSSQAQGTMVRFDNFSSDDIF